MNLQGDRLCMCHLLTNTGSILYGRIQEDTLALPPKLGALGLSKDQAFILTYLERCRYCRHAA